MYKFIIATGGTGGHIFPALSLLDKLTKKGHKSLVVADDRFLNFKAQIPSYVKYRIIKSGSLVGNSISKAISIVKIVIGMMQALFIIWRYKPNMVISFGGYISFPTMVAAVLLRVPLLIHEQNSVIGKANKVLQRWAKVISVAFPDTKGISGDNAKKIFVTGNPVNSKIISLRKQKYPELNKNSKIQILVLGGSQGARILSQIVPESIVKLDKKFHKNIEILQQCRKEDLEKVKKTYAKYNIKADINVFFNDIPKKLKKTHLVICRSGASTVSEIIAAGRPAIFVPLAIAADNHQFFNAKSLSDKNAAWLAEEKDFNAKYLTDLIHKLICKPGMLQKAADLTAAQFIDSGEELLNLIEKFCRKAK